MENLKFISFSIDLKQIPEDKKITKNNKGEAFKNGGEFVNLTMFINEEEDKYGNNVSITLSKDKNSTEKTIYVGNGKAFTK